MNAGSGRQRAIVKYLLAGLQTGVLSALAMLAWLGATAMWYRKTFWTAPNLLASLFYGESALRNRFTAHTFSGLALYLIIYGSVGMLFGLGIQDRRGIRVLWIGILSAIGCYFLMFGWILKHWDPLLLLYTQERPMLAGHVLFGAMLGRYPRNLNHLLRAPEGMAPKAAVIPLPPGETARREE